MLKNEAAACVRKFAIKNLITPPKKVPYRAEWAVFETFDVGTDGIQKTQNFSSITIGSFR